MKKILASLLLSAIVLAGCSKVPVTGRTQFALVPESEMLALSKTEYDSVLQYSNVINNTAESNMIKTVGSRLAAATSKYLQDNGFSDRVSEFQWEYNLIQSNEVNAWCMPGGKIAFYTGILPYTQNDKGVAVVMGHEISHAVAKHGNERMSQALAAQLGGMALDVALSQKPAATRNLFQMAYGVTANLAVLLPFSRKQESEADKLGLVFMSMAGYDPHEAITFWQRMSAQGGAAPPEFLSTHPSDERRIRDIQKFMDEAMKYYKPQ